jgi:hypothetical protein
MVKKIVFTIADDNNLKYAEMMEKSLRKFHSEEDLPLVVIKGDDLKARLTLDPMFFYRATPIIASELLKDYDVVIKIDADSIVTGDLSDAWKEPDIDMACVFNSNPKELQTYPVTVWDINPLEYLNCGFVVMRNKDMVEHWKNLCFTYHFNNYQMKEQDLLNILCHYGVYKVQVLDMGDSFFGLASKGYWQYIEVVNKKLSLPPQEGYTNVSKWIKVLHWAGGNTPDKMNYRIHFKESVVKWLDKITK